MRQSVKPTLEEVKGRVRAEHALLRVLLARVADAADAVVGGVAEPSRLRDAVWDLFVTMDEHLAMEEADLLPILASRDPLGYAGVAGLLGEHRQQREMILALVSESEDETKSVRELAGDARWLTAALARDMDAEDDAIARMHSNEAWHSTGG